MPKHIDQTPDRPLRETEQATYHAFREWPLFLILRQKERLAKQTEAAASQSSPGKAPPSAAKAGQP